MCVPIRDIIVLFYVLFVVTFQEEELAKSSYRLRFTLLNGSGPILPV